LQKRARKSRNILKKSRSLSRTNILKIYMKSFFLSIAIGLLTISLSGQSLQISESRTSSKHLESDLTASVITISESDGSVINTNKYELKGSDSSFKIYPLQNGAYIVRENVANFVMYDTFGSVIRPISNSSQSKDGEKISELAMDPMGKTIVLYNPQIRNGSKRGSRAKVIGLENAERDIFFREDEEIRAVRVSESGEFIAIASGKEGSDDNVTVMDRYGNEIQTIAFDQQVKGLNLYGSGSILTVFSEGRVAVYNVLSGERLGSSSFRGAPLQFANYSASDQIIVGLTGDLNGEILSNIEVRIINVAARKIASQEYSGTLQISDLDNITMTKKSRHNYTLSGMSKDLNLKASF